MPTHGPLPLTMLIPTRNAMGMLPAHLDAIGPLLDQPAAFVVVDSESNDGSVEFLRQWLPTDRTRFFTRPRGLYQSWNYGIQQVTTPYVYVSTVGDAISREGLPHLHAVACKHDADVVISPPVFINTAGEPIEGNDWPIHHMVSVMHLQQDILLEGLTPFLLALSFLPFAILGSSASNLYRTTTLQQHPFPTEFGTNGDGAWGILNGLGLRLAITPQRVGFYRKHRKVYSKSEYRSPDGDARMLAAGLKILEQAMSEHPALRLEAESLHLDEFIAAKKEVQHWRTLLQKRRRRFLPWILNPVALRARRERQKAHQKCIALADRLLTSKEAYSYRAPSSAAASPSA